MRKDHSAKIDRLSHSTQVRVRFEECDPLGVVWHGNYIRYFEEGREAFCREHGISYLDVKNNLVATPIVKSVCEHKRPLRFGDVATVHTYFEDSPAAKLIFHYKIFDQHGELACTGSTVQVFLDLKEEWSLMLNTPEIVLGWKRKVGLLDG